VRGNAASVPAVETYVEQSGSPSAVFVRRPGRAR